MIIELTQASQTDLKIIKENLDAFNGTGLTFIDQITSLIGKLKHSPKIGASLQTKIDIVTDFRFLVFPFTKKQVYIIIYRISEPENIIYINRVFDGRMNYLNILFGE